MTVRPVVWACALSVAAISGACAADPCADEPAAVTVTFDIAPPSLRERVRSLDVTITVDADRYQKTFPVEPSSGAPPKLAVQLEPAPTQNGFKLIVEVRAFATNDGTGAPLAISGQRRIEGTPDACNQIEIPLREGDPRDGGTRDSGANDGSVSDGGEPDGGNRDGGPPGAPTVVPASFDAPWVDREHPPAFVADVAFAGDPSELTATSTIPWIGATLTPGGAGVHQLTLTIDTLVLDPGPHRGSVRVAVTDGDSIDVPIDLRIFRPVHIGPVSDQCPHPAPDGTTNTLCGYSGLDGIVEASLLAVPYEHFVLHDADGAPAYYDSTTDGIVLPGPMWISGREGVAPDNVLVKCEFGRGLVLTDDDVRVESFGIIAAEACDQVITTWSTEEAEDGSGGHEIDRMLLGAFRPEVYGRNSIEHPLGLSENTRVTNSVLIGYWEGVGDLTFAHGTSFIGNTFVSYQRLDTVMTVTGTRDLTVANNVFIVPSGGREALVTADAQTTGFKLFGNTYEGHAALVSGLDGGDATNVVADNTDQALQIETPRRPVFFRDAQPLVSTLVPGVGRSFDDVDIDGQTPDLPGAFQQRSSVMGPRRDVVTLGPSGCASCDFTTDLANEVQHAAWSVWPGGTLEIEPGLYAGNAVISWNIGIRGVNGGPDEIILENRDEDLLLIRHQTWTGHDAVLAYTDDAVGLLPIENFTVVVDSNRTPRGHGIYLEGSRTLRNVEVRTGDDSSGGLTVALHAGNGVLVQDVLLRGSWSTCARLAGGVSNGVAHRPASVTLVNVTCRLQGQGRHRPVSGFDVANVFDTSFINVIVEALPGIPEPALFRAQRRSVGDTGALALDPPDSFAAFAMHHRGFEELFDGFLETSGTYDQTGAASLPDTAPLFVGPNNAHLQPLSPARDTGIDPSSVSSVLSPGSSLDGVARTGRQIDRGCYEEGG